jgi:hypothetical protein
MAQRLAEQQLGETVAKARASRVAKIDALVARTRRPSSRDEDGR